MRIKIEFEIDLPNNINATDEEIEEFLRFELNDNGVINGSNPFINHSIEPIFGTFEWELITSK